MHDIYRDWLAVSRGGIAEPRVDNWLLDKSDVWVSTDPTELIEVVVLQGTGATQLKMGVGQLKGDEYQLEDLLGEKIDSSILFVVKGAEPEEIDGQEKQIEAKQGYLHAQGLTLEVATARQDFPTGYNIGGIDFDRPKNVGIKRFVYGYIQTIRDDFQVVEHLSETHHNFLLAMADAWARLALDTRAQRVEASAVEVRSKQGMALEVITAKQRYDVKLSMLVDAFFMVTHYEWMTRPAM